MGLRDALQRGIRPSRTRGAGALWAKSLLNAVLFFCIFMLALPWAAHHLLPRPSVVPVALSRWPAALLFVGGIGLWLACLDAFSRRGHGTPLPMDAPRSLVTEGPFAVIRNPIMAAELLVVWGEALYLGSLGVVLYALLLSAAAAAAVRFVEEPELRRRFGAEYDAYCARVPRWLPRPGGRRRGTAPPEAR